MIYLNGDMEIFFSYVLECHPKIRPWYFCGKSEPEQGCPVWTGSPYVRLRKVRLG